MDISDNTTPQHQSVVSICFTSFVKKFKPALYHRWILQQNDFRYICFLYVTLNLLNKTYQNGGKYLSILLAFSSGGEIFEKGTE